MKYLNYELDNNEKFVALVRKHWAVLMFPWAKVVVSIAVILLLKERIFELEVGITIFTVWIITSILYGVYAVIIWYLDCFIITDKRIIDIDQRGAFRRVVAEIGIDNIQEAIYEIDGPLEAFFNFGAVKIKTASSGSMIGMEEVPDPAGVKNLIIKVQKSNYQQ